MAAILALCACALFNAYTTDQPWAGEVANTWLITGFFVAVWAGTELAARRQRGW